LVAQGNTSHLFLVALVMGTAFMLWRAQRRAAAAPAAPRATARPAKALDPHAPAELARWQAELHEFAREISARIDTKMAALEHLMRAAHHEALRLEETLERAQHLIGSPVVAEEWTAADEAPAQAGLHQAQSLLDAARASAESECMPARELPGPGRRCQEIYTLADVGLPSHEIARRLGTPIGEVELILSLRQP
jgi:hypothetical protein